MIRYYQHDNPTTLESGNILPAYTIAYQTFGKINEAKDNVVWIVHALTANSDPQEWWPGVVGVGQVINPDDHFIICANVLGSHYGSTSPLHLNPLTTKPYYREFPLLTPRDLSISYAHLADYLGIDRIKLLVGASLGGQQCMEWAIHTDITIDNLCLIATNAKHSAYGIAFNESQRLAIAADPTFFEDRPDGGLEGLKVARSIALLSYRTSFGYNDTQTDIEPIIDDFRASSYQRYQGEKLAKRFNAYSYFLFTKTMDAHNVGRGYPSIAYALAKIKANTTIIGITSDILFTIEESQLLHQHIPKSHLHTIESNLGHDGFLTESSQVSSIIASML